jgi:type I restriction enzyme S subunit
MNGVKQMKKSRLVVSGDFILSNSMSFGKPYIMDTTGAIYDGCFLEITIKF